MISTQLHMSLSVITSDAIHKFAPNSIHTNSCDMTGIKWQLIISHEMNSDHIIITIKVGYPLHSAITSAMMANLDTLWLGLGIIVTVILQLLQQKTMWLLHSIISTASSNMCAISSSVTTVIYLCVAVFIRKVDYICTLHSVVVSAICSNTLIYCTCNIID